MKRILLASAAALTMTAAPAMAEQTPAQIAALSAELLLEGIERDDPILLIAAAKLRWGLTLAKTDRQPEKDLPPPAMDEVGPIGWEEILDAAVAMAPEDDIILTLADDLRSTSDKGVRSGQVYSITAIRNGGTDTYPPMTYRGSEYADVYVEGSGNADLNLFVYDAQKRLVCSDTDISAIAHCGWTPAQDAPFTIVVKNRGRGDSGYSLITN